MKQNLFIDVLDFDLNTMKIHDLYEVNDNIIKIDLSRDNLKSILLYVDYHTVLSFNDKSCVINLKNSINIKKKLEDIDGLIVSELQQRKIIKRLKKKFSYKQMVSSVPISDDENLDVLNMHVNMSNDAFKTKLYFNNSTEIKLEDAQNLMKNNCLIKFVIELTSIVIDKNESLIYIENIIRQIKIKKIKPKRIEKLPYSFIDSENENDSENEDILSLKSPKSVESVKSTKSINNHTNDKDIIRNILDYPQSEDDNNMNDDNDNDNDTSTCESYDE